MKNRILKYFISKISFIVLFLTFSGQHTESQSKEKYANKWYEIPGEPVRIYLDTVTPLTKLIQKLKIPRTIDTGYTVEMYSIASYKKKAIQPLLDFYSENITNDTRKIVIQILRIIARGNQPPNRSLISTPKLVENEAKIAIMSLLRYSGHDDEICDFLKWYCTKNDFPYLLKILKERRIESIAYYQILYNIYSDNYSKETNILSKIPIDISETIINADGEIKQPYIEIILNWIKLHKKVIIDSQLKTCKEWEQLSFLGIYSDNQVLIKYLSLYYNPNDSNSRKYRNIFITQINNELHVYGTKRAREMWLLLEKK